MQISAIEEVSGGRSRIVLDSGEHFILYKGEIRILKLKPEMELRDDLYKRIMTEILPKRAKLRVMNLLKSRPYTEYQLMKKLKDGEYPEAVCNNAIDYVKSFGYVNDREYACEFIRCKSGSHSRKELFTKLMQKGIRKDVIETAFSDMYGSYRDDRADATSELDVIVKALKKRGYTGDETYEEKQKMLAYFYRRGFEIDSVRKAMDMCKDTD